MQIAKERAPKELGKRKDRVTKILAKGWWEESSPRNRTWRGTSITLAVIITLFDMPPTRHAQCLILAAEKRTVINIHFI